MSRATRSQRPSRQVARAVTSPAGVSSTTVVSGSSMVTMPVSRRTVVTQMLLEPDMAWAWSAWRTRKAASASGRVGGSSRLTLICRQPRGSWITNRRSESSAVLMWIILSSMVSPGTSMTPPVTTLPTSPSQWASTMVRVRDQRMNASP